MKISSISLLLLVFFFGCQQEQSQAQSRVNAADFEAFMEAHEDEQILDVRTDGECAMGVIPGAVQVDFRAADFEEQVVAKLDKDKPVLVYCAAGGRSARAQAKLVKLGFTEVVDLEGGMGAWKGAGKATKTLE